MLQYPKTPWSFRTQVSNEFGFKKPHCELLSPQEDFSLSQTHLILGDSGGWATVTFIIILRREARTTIQKFFLLCSRSNQNLLILINSLFQLPAVPSDLSMQPWMIQFLFGPALGYGIGGWRMGLPTCSLLYWHKCPCDRTLEANGRLDPISN